MSRFILPIFQFKYEIGVKFYPIFTVLTLGSPPLIEIFFTFKCCGFFLAKYNLLLFFKYQTRLFIGSPPLLPKLTTTTSISSPPWSQTSNPTLATTLFSHGSGMPLSLSLFVGSSFNGFKKWDCLAFCIYRGIRKMKDLLPSQILNEKLPWFLQKCAQTFDSDLRYKNDLWYLRIWLRLVFY